jgi:hypothetical protein
MKSTLVFAASVAFLPLVIRRGAGGTLVGVATGAAADGEQMLKKDRDRGGPAGAFSGQGQAKLPGAGQFAFGRSVGEQINAILVEAS